MKAIMVMFDSLNRHFLPPYGCDWVIAPNFKRLADRTVVFERCYIGSMPCMPARRELHTGRYNFLHRSWGPLEPFDDSMPEILKKNGVYTHLATDHQHYFEDGGATYHHRYNTWHFSRGQEGDCWKGSVRDPEIPPNLKRRITPTWRQDWVNRPYLTRQEDLPQHQTFQNGIEFIRANAQADKWFLQIETFDPHEPFYTLPQFKQLYAHAYNGPHFDWPDYNLVNETEEQVQHLRYEYAALLSMCDHYLGQVLDVMDELDLWRDTMLIVNTDHGFLLSEHGFWGKNFQPLYNEIANIPLFIWDPRSGGRGERRSSLVQTIDLAPTLLEYFGVPRPPDMQGSPLGQAVADDTPVRAGALFGYHGCHVGVTDGRYVYLRAPVKPDNRPLYEYTLMPAHIKAMFSPNELQQIELAEPLTFSKGCRLLKIEGQGSVGSVNSYLWGSLLFDLQIDPQQEHPLQDAGIEKRMAQLLVNLMRWNDAPPEQYERLGLPVSGPVEDYHLALKRVLPSEDAIGGTSVRWAGKGRLMYYTLLHLLPNHLKRQTVLTLEEAIHRSGRPELDEELVSEMFMQVAPRESQNLLQVFGRVVKSRG